MKDAVEGQRTTVKGAAKTLGVSEKSIHRYLSKGLLTKFKEGTRTYIPVHEVTNLLGKSQDKKGESLSRSRHLVSKGHSWDIVTLHRERYEGLLIELGELRKQVQFLGEIKETLSLKDAAIRDYQADIRQLNTRLEFLEGKEKETLEQLDLKDQRVKELETELEQLKGQKLWWQR